MGQIHKRNTNWILLICIPHVHVGDTLGISINFKRWLHIWRADHCPMKYGEKGVAGKSPGRARCVRVMFVKHSWGSNFLITNRLVIQGLLLYVNYVTVCGYVHISAGALRGQNQAAMDASQERTRSWTNCSILTGNWRKQLEIWALDFESQDPFHNETWWRKSRYIYTEKWDCMGAG